MLPINFFETLFCILNVLSLSMRRHADDINACSTFH